MRKHLIPFAIALGMALLSACHGTQGKGSALGADSLEATADSATRIALRYAEGFQVSYAADGLRLVEIRDPQGASRRVYRFALLSQGAEAGAVPEGYTPLQVPVRSVVCMTSLQLSNFICLDALSRVTGITSTRHLFNTEMQGRLAQGKTAKIGIEGNFDNEVIMALAPDLILISPFKRGGYDALEETDIPLVPHLGYKERTPLAQAEWIKFVGLLTGQEQEANERFAAIEQRYNDLKALAAKAERRPMVLSGEMRGGNWYAVGGESFLAQLFRDAGADYFLQNNTTSGGLNLDFETVYSRAAEAQFWRIVNSHDGEYSYDALRASDARYADFRAFRERRVLYCNMRQTPFYERMPVEPDRVLADMIHAFHPELMPDHEPTYYSLLK